MSSCRLKSDDVALERGVSGHDEFSRGVDRVHQVSFDGLTDLDRIMTADLDLKACSFGEDGLRGRHPGGRGCFRRGGCGPVLERLRRTQTH